MRNIIRELDRRKFRPHDIDKIMGGNFLRVFGANFG
jgi:microsomal dipeptidase-like Zn-dependent dipeptidase